MEIPTILEKLAYSKFRASFKLKASDKEYINQKGLQTIKEHAYQFAKTRLSYNNPNDGKQTPTKGHPVFIAQHATATCCRKCLQKWHKIRNDHSLNEKEINYIVNVIMAWIGNQLNN